MVQLSPAFYKKLLEVSSNVGMKPEDILSVMASESGLNPSASNPNGNATGLIQFMPATLKGLGYKGTPDDFKNVSDVNQLYYIEKIIKNMSRLNGGPLTSATQYYIGNFIPAALQIPGVRNHDHNAIICSKNPTMPHIPGVSPEREAIFYKINTGLDYNKDGNITYGDIDSIIKRVHHNEKYLMALNDLSKYTNYKPNMPSSKHNDSGFGVAMNNLLERFLQSVMASEKNNKKLYKKYLPYNNALIKINGNDYTNSIEFARILCLALEEELFAKSFIHTNGTSVEVEISVPGPTSDTFKTTEQLVVSLAETFFDATKKIGGVEVKTQLITNKKSSFQPINLKMAETQYRKFMLKFV